MLLARRDELYRLFQGRLMPSVDPECILGVPLIGRQRFWRKSEQLQ